MEDIIIKNYKIIKLKIAKNEKHLCKCYLADSFFKRFKGLMLASPLVDDEALFLTKTNSIHMFFMKYELDIIFLDKDNHIVEIINSIKRRRVTKIYSKAVSVVELKAGYLKSFDLSIGDLLEEYE